MIAFVNGHYVNLEEAVLGISDLSIQRSFGIFDFFRTVDHIPLFIDDYLDRFFSSAQQLRLATNFSRDDIRQIVFDLIEKNRIATSGIKMILTGGYSSDGFEQGTPNLIVTQQPALVSTSAEFEKGLQIILHEYLRDLPTAKSINYLMAIYLREKLIANNADDVLYYMNDQVLEFPRSNVFIVTKGETVITPSEKVLHGITRKKVIEIAGKHFEVEETKVTPAELKNAAEVFLTSTTKRLLPVLSIDGVPVGDGIPGKVTRKIYDSFLELEHEYCTSSQHLEKLEVAGDIVHLKK